MPSSRQAYNCCIYVRRYLTLPLPVELPLRYCRRSARGSPPPGTEDEKFHEVRETWREDVDGNRRDECLASRRVPLDAFGRFRRQFRRGRGVSGSEELLLSLLSSIILMLMLTFMVMIIMMVAVVIGFELNVERKRHSSSRQ